MSGIGGDHHAGTRSLLFRTIRISSLASSR
jgi:hypothetical protein